jgi:hypothetical protein
VSQFVKIRNDHFLNSEERNQMNSQFILVVLLFAHGYSYSRNIPADEGYAITLSCTGGGKVRINSWYAETTDTDAWYRSKIIMYLSPSLYYADSDYSYGPVYHKSWTNIQTTRSTYYLIMYCDNYYDPCPVSYTYDYSCILPTTSAPTAIQNQNQNQPLYPSAVRSPTAFPKITMPPTSSSTSSNSTALVQGLTSYLSLWEYVLQLCIAIGEEKNKRQRKRRRRMLRLQILP